MAEVSRWWLALAGVGGLVIVVELLIAVPLVIRLRRRIAQLSGLVALDAGVAESELLRLQLALADSRRLLLPYRRLLKYLRHPLVIALLASLRRRRARAA
jgi:hypothetical protein